MIEQAFALVLVFTTAHGSGDYSVTVLPSGKACDAVKEELLYKKNMYPYSKLSVSCIPLIKD